MFHCLFQPFSSMIPILLVQSIYNVNKSLNKPNTFFVIFSKFSDHWKPKTDSVDFHQNRSGKLAK
jgi:hypothetical protein